MFVCNLETFDLTTNKLKAFAGFLIYLPCMYTLVCTLYHGDMILLSQCEAPNMYKIFSK